MSGHVHWTPEPFASADLLHLLTCSTCRAWMIGRLLEEASRDEETLDAGYGDLWGRLKAKLPEHVEKGRERREAAGRLLRELLAAEPRTRPGLLRDGRFQNPDLLDLLLETSGTHQIDAPESSAELARLATVLSAAMGEDDADAADLLPRALCLEANARRLLADFQSAEALLRKSASFLSSIHERAFYCRTAGLLRWDQGRADEAIALLQHAARLYAPGGPAGEEESCLALLGLLHDEQGCLGQALSLLLRAWATMDRDLHPPLSLRVALALAAGLAEAEQTREASGMLKEGWRLSSRVNDAGEMIRVYWLEARALARLGEAAEAVGVFDSVRRKLLQEPSPAEAALVSLDQALALAEAGKPEEIQPLFEALETAFQPSPAPLFALRALGSFAEAAQRGDPELRAMSTALAVRLRAAFRGCGERMRPVPFA